MATKKSGGGAVGLRRLTKKKQAIVNARSVQRADKYRIALPIAQSAPPFEGEYTEDLGERLGILFANGCTIDEITSLQNMPPLWKLLKWIYDTKHPLNQIYYDAKRLLIALYEERAINAATTPLPGVITVKRQAVTKDGDVVDLEEERHIDNVERSRLQVQAYGWALSHMAPKKHGKNAQSDGNEGSKQLESLFNALMQGPAE